MAKYQGHRSYNAWNVSLWMGSDEGLYRYSKDLCKRIGIEKASRQLAMELKGQKTPDGAIYNYTCIREALRGFV